MDKAPTKCDLDSIMTKMNELESRIKELENRNLKIERIISKKQLKKINVLDMKVMYISILKHKKK